MLLDPIAYEPGDPTRFEASRAVWDLADRPPQPHFPPGVYKHRSIEDAQVLCEQWDQANFEAFHARRQAQTPSESADEDDGR